MTGASGFIGRHMTRALEVDAGCDVTGIDVATGTDARDFFRHSEASFDVVVHAAAAGADRVSIDGNPLALAVNLELDAAMFGWAARTRPGRVVYLSSSAAYDVRLQDGRLKLPLAEDWLHLDGKHGFGPPDGIYGQIKLAGEQLAVKAREAGVPVTVARPFSGYGEDQDPGRFPFPALMQRARRREDPFVIWGSGRQVRDFVHVDDICAAVLAMVDQDIDGPVNIGTGRPTSMIDLARMACHEAGYSPVFQPLPGKPAGVEWRVANVARLCEISEPAVSLEEGVFRALAAVPA